jgi:dTDP-4-dehydrorhamnose reductase
VLAAHDLVVSPTYMPHLVDAVLDLLIDGEQGIWHLANVGQVSWAEFAALAAQLANLDDALVRRVSVADLGLSAPRPAFSALESVRGRIMPPLERAMTEYVASPCSVWRERRARWRGVSA